MSAQGPGRIDLDELKAAIDIADLAQRLGLEVKGRMARCYNAQAHSHNDKRPSLGFYDGGRRYRCFVCNTGGTALDLYMAVKGVDLQAAARDLAEIYGLTPRPSGQAPARRPERAQAARTTAAPAAPKAGESAPDSELYEALAAYCAGPDPEALAYLTGPKRGLTPETVRRFGFFTIKDYAATGKHLLDRFGRDRCAAAGILSGAGRLSFYHHRLLIPYTLSGRIVFLQGRRLDDGAPKYLNLTGVGAALFNADRLGDLTPGARVYLTEGAFDAAILEQYGRPALGVVGIQGFKAEWAKLLAPYDVCLVYDNPKPGAAPEERAREEATLAAARARVASIFLTAGRKITAKRLPAEFKDLTDYLVVNPNYPTPKAAPAETPTPAPAAGPAPDALGEKLANVFGRVDEVHNGR